MYPHGGGRPRGGGGTAGPPPGAYQYANAQRKTVPLVMVDAIHGCDECPSAGCRLLRLSLPGSLRRFDEDLAEELPLGDREPAFQGQEEEGDVHVRHTPPQRPTELREGDALLRGREGFPSLPDRGGCRLEPLLVGHPHHLVHIDLGLLHHVAGPAPAALLPLRGLEHPDQLVERHRPGPQVLAFDAPPDLPLQPLDGAQVFPGLEARLVGLGEPFVVERTLIIDGGSQVLGLHPQKHRGVEERPPRNAQIPLAELVQLLQEPVRHLHDIDVPGVDLPPFCHPHQDLDRFLTHGL